MSRYDDILSFWFEGVDEAIPLTFTSAPVQKWFGGSAEMDQRITDLFSADLNNVRRRKFESWKNIPHGRLALIIVSDQFSRTIFRNDPKAFDMDAEALTLSLEMIKNESDQAFKMFERIFLYMPLMHAESLAIQEKGVELYSRLYQAAQSMGHPFAEYLQGTLVYAERHRDVIKRFNRFPHRNPILNRQSTAEEQRYLAEPGSGF